jgi:DNA-binding MarR family transcriptional regulator
MPHASGRWGLVRADWVDHPDVGANEIAVLSVLSLYVGRDGTCFPSQATLAARLKVSRGWVIRVLNRLAELGLVRREQRRSERGRVGSCLYTVEGHVEAMRGACRNMRRQTGEAVQTQEVGADESVSVAPHGVAPAKHEQRAKPESGISHRARDARAREEGSKMREMTLAKTVPPLDWMPTSEDCAFAAERAPDLDPNAFAALFVQSCRAHGYRYADHSAAFRTWILTRWENPYARRDHARCDHHPFPHHRAGGSSSGSSSRPADGRFDADRSATNRDAALTALALLAD